MSRKDMSFVRSGARFALANSHASKFWQLRGGIVSNDMSAEDRTGVRSSSHNDQPCRLAALRGTRLCPQSPR